MNNLVIIISCAGTVVGGPITRKAIDVLRDANLRTEYERSDTAYFILADIYGTLEQVQLVTGK